jgi:alkaline phosphatase D
VDRRSFLAGLAAAGTAACASDATTESAGGAATGPVGAAEPAAAPLPPGVFGLGVASGDPLDDRVILWTRLASEPLAADGGAPAGPVEVAYDVSTDPTFSALVASGLTSATPELGHSVHVDVTGLQPDTVYFYRFRTADQTSPAGRTRTFPRADADPGRFRFVFASCQDLQWGRFPVWGRAAEEDDLDAIVFLGDYIYELNLGDLSPSKDGERVWAGPEPVTLEDYRRRYAQTTADPQLQAARGAAPWFVTWDDHEVSNNYAGDVAQTGITTPTPEARARRIAAYQAWYENTPIRIEPEPTDFDALVVHRDLRFGSLAQLYTIETRQSADVPACRTDGGLNSDKGPLCDEARDEERSILGEAQEAWLTERLTAATARWNIITNPIMLAELNLGTDQAPSTMRDTWSGYPAARRRLLDTIRTAEVANPVVVTGDWHSSFVLDVTDDSGQVVMPELLGGSVSTVIFESEDFSVANPNVRYWKDAHCYAVVTVTDARLLCEFKYVDDIWDVDAPVTETDSFEVLAGEHSARRL